MLNFRARRLKTALLCNQYNMYLLEHGSSIDAELDLTPSVQDFGFFSWLVLSIFTGGVCKISGSFLLRLPRVM